MKLAVKNLGKIDEAEINLNKDLIILTGPNNTGKSYLTYLIHALYNHQLLMQEEDKLSLNYEILNKIGSSEYLTNELSSNKPIFSSDVIRHHKNYIEDILENKISDKTVTIFASKNIKPKIDITIDDVKTKYREEEIIGICIKNDSVYGVHGDKELSSEPFKPYENETALEGAQTLLLLAVARDLRDRNIFGRSFMFPAERTAINVFARDMVSNRAQLANNIDLLMLEEEDLLKTIKKLKQQQQINPKYPLAINNYVDFVSRFEGLNTTTEFSVIAEEIERRILGGSISVSEHKQISFLPQGSKQGLSLHESSSLIKSLSFLVIYLRHFTAEGDCIIIDEPEINLHPNLQIELARIFGKIINAGIRLIISTHSDYLIKQINNQILLFDLSKKKGYKKFIREHKYNDDELIDKSRVGAYYLHNGQVDEINLEGNGLEVPSINDAIKQVDGLAEELFLELE